MFLAQLNRKELNLFIDLGIYAARSNEKLDTRQRDYLQIYMAVIDRNINDFKVDRTEKEILEEIKNTCNEKIVKIIFIEIIKLIMLDKKYDSKEQEFIQRLQEAFNLPDEEVGKMFRGVNHMIASYKELLNVLGIEL